MKETFDPTVIWGDGMSSLHDWLKIATPEDCMELLKGVDRGDPDRILLLDDPDSNTAPLGYCLRRLYTILQCLRRRAARLSYVGVLSKLRGAYGNEGKREN